MKNTSYLCLSVFFALLLATPVFLSGQQSRQLVDDYLLGQKEATGLTEADIDDLRVTDEYANRRNGIIYIYLQQTLNDIDLRGATANGVIKDGRLYHFNADRLMADVASRTAAQLPMLNAVAAVKKAAGDLGLTLPGQLSILQLDNTADQATTIAPDQFALEPVTARLVYDVDREETIRLSWEVQLYEKNAQHHWLLRVDALNGNILYKRDQVLHCEFGHPEHLHAAGTCQGTTNHSKSFDMPENLMLGGSYLVFPMPVESPNHGDQALVTDVDNLVASPYGWHDTDGTPGTEFTITRGNNVHAYDDVDNDNGSNGQEPDGGADLFFNHPFDPGGNEVDVREAAIVNLFYWCNLMHDVWYLYGFDELAGNFQSNNYGNGGEAGDYIRAEAQDGSGTNNANFSSGGDGSNARIQMYLWTSGGGSAPQLLTVNSPASVAGSYGAEEALFGPGLPADPLTGDLVQVDDSSFNPTLGCFALTNGDDLEGKIALVDRGLCSFVQKVQNAQDAGAIAVIVCNDQGGNPTPMGGDGPNINIPSVMISEDDCTLIKTELTSGINVTLDASGGGGLASFKDGDFDSGIICHEYGHGLSIRMTGGPSTGNCLFNDEQMGEGWSDYVGLMMTMEEGDLGTDVRGIGTYAINEPVDGDGIRPAPYSTDFAINDYTYGNTNGGSLSQPHGIGFVWCTMLWDLTWALIDEYGFDPDLYNGAGGNNIAMHLVTEGMKLQACTPGFVDGRDGILLADELFYNSQHRCLIWEAFAKRGLGFSAEQGSSNDRNDQVEAFDLAPWCLDPIVPPVSDFLVDVTENCFGAFNFTNTSTEVPQTWLWDFGDGNTSQAYNASHTYSEEGVFEVQLIVTNTLGADTASLFVTVDFPDPATPTSSATGCEGTTAVLTATAPSTVFWYLNGIKVAEGDTYETAPLEPGMVVEVTNAVPEDPLTGGPVDNGFGTGGYHNTGFTGTVLFEAHQGFVLESVFVDADGDGNRQIELFNENGDVVNSVTVFMPNGQSQVELNLEVPGPGNYAVGGSSIALYRNDSGAMYPYELGNVATITGSPAGSEFYYYLYNWVIRPAPCESAKVPVDLTILEGPEATFEYLQAGATFDFTDLTAGAVSWLWDFGDGATSMEENPSHTYAQDGTYTVTLTVENAECSTTISEEVVIELVGTSSIQGLELFELYPVPGAGEPFLNLLFEQQSDVRIQVINKLGQVVWQDQAKGVERYNRRLDLSDQAAGAYFIAVQVGDQKAYRRYVLMR